MHNTYKKRVTFFVGGAESLMIQFPFIEGKNALNSKMKKLGFLRRGTDLFVPGILTNLKEIGILAMF